MFITPTFTNLINNRQNSQNTAFGSGLAINAKYPKTRGRDHKQHRPSVNLGVVVQFLTRKKSELSAILSKVLQETGAVNDNMRTIELVAQLKSEIDTEVVIKLRGGDEKPITISNWVMLKDEKWSTDKASELASAVEQKARESAALTKQAKNAENATQTAGTLVANA